MKKTFLVILVLIASGLIWYLFVKEYDYQFQMEAKYGPGTVYQEISEWKKFDLDSNKENLQVVSKDPYKSLEQKLSSSDDTVHFLWEFEKTEDTITQITLNVKSDSNKLSNRLDIINPFKESSYIDSLKQNLLTYKKSLDTKQEMYSVSTSDSIVRSPEMDCICYTSNNVPVNRKAFVMVNTISFLEDYVLERDIKLTGYPFIKVSRWDRENDLIDFDFCFPVNLAQDIRPSGNIQFRQVKSSSALKAVFNGNYRSSHLAWNDLVYTAEEKGIVTSKLPLEVFFNNPKVETNAAKEWKAEIFLPVIE